MRKRMHDQAAKALALELLAAHGKIEAARQTGIPEGTIASWGHRCGVKAPTSAEVAKRVEAMRLGFNERRLELGNRIGEVAAAAAEAVDHEIANGRSRQAREFAGALAVLVDKAQLLTGGATGRTEASLTTTGEEAERRQQATTTVDELAQRRAS